MDFNAELRYYEILFIRTIHSFHEFYRMDKLTAFIEMISFVAEANTSLVASAMQAVLSDPIANRIHKEEYIICLKLFSGMNDTQIRQVVKCSPNTIKNAMANYENENIFIKNKLSLEQSNEVRKVMKNLRKINEIY